ncbi:MAG: TMEM175 family protein [Saprospiraceae bacterium]
MTTFRLEAFSDAVIAIIITIMVLEFKIPEGTSLEDLKPIIPIFISYLISFIYLGIYWNNHHHMFHITDTVNGGILWANLHLLFWLSLVPFTTGWMGEHHFEGSTLFIYGFNLLMAALAYFILQLTILKKMGKDSLLERALGSDIKGKMSPVLYILGMISSFYSPMLSGGFYILVALIWIIPDTRIERTLKEDQRLANESRGKHNL